MIHLLILDSDGGATLAERVVGLDPAAVWPMDRLDLDATCIDGYRAPVVAARTWRDGEDGPVLTVTCFAAREPAPVAP